EGRWLAPVPAVRCASDSGGPTLSELYRVEPDRKDMRVDNSLDQAMVGYGKFLKEAPESALTPEAMRRLADLKLEKEYGILGGQKGAPAGTETAALPAPEASARVAPATQKPRPNARAPRTESDEAFERRALGAATPKPADDGSPLELPGGMQASPAGPLEAIKLYDQILATYPDYPHADAVLYQKARALDELGRVD